MRVKSSVLSLTLFLFCAVGYSQPSSIDSIILEVKYVSIRKVETYKYEIIKTGKNSNKYEVKLNEARYHPYTVGTILGENWEVLISLDSQLLKVVDQDIDTKKEFLDEVEEKYGRRVMAHYLEKLISDDRPFNINFKGDSILYEMEEAPIVRLEKSLTNFEEYSSDDMILNSLNIDSAWVANNLHTIQNYIVIKESDSSKHPQLLKCMANIEDIKRVSKLLQKRTSVGISYFFIKTRIRYSNFHEMEFICGGNNPFLLPCKMGSFQSFNANISIALSEIIPESILKGGIKSKVSKTEYVKEMMGEMRSFCR
ncbi:hypothetical protein R9C00_27420 [Flammeovirgaceae bacterium SG7u.111]|nr:hypothetical protein [Flammeovirgaceae bacterium SG7u.132]WPO35430.1 hypothetical protein R9C00_27420 [Flammeovirgaceae bacterium SG7u.111]